MYSINVDPNKMLRAFNKLPEELDKTIRISLKTCAQKVIDQARILVKNKYNISGKSRVPASIQIDRDQSTDKEIVIGLNSTECPHSVYLHEGTKDHMVPKEGASYFAGKKGRANGGSEPASLHWVSNKQDGFSKGHMVSGIEKYEYLYIAAKDRESELQAIVERDVYKALYQAGMITQ